MSQMILPDARFRSPTAVEGKSDMRSDWVYSAIIAQHGGAGQQKVFTVPQGQSIPRLAGSSITAPTAGSQTTYTELTTNLTMAGQLGSSIGDAAFKGIGIVIQQAYYDSSGVPNTYGAGQQETSELLSKTFFQLKIAGKLQTQGATHMYPAGGGMAGSISTTENAVTTAVVNNGAGPWRFLKIPILVARTDTVEGTFGVAGGDSLTFSVTTGIGQPVLLWFKIDALVKGDVR